MSARAVPLIWISTSTNTLDSSHKSQCEQEKAGFQPKVSGYFHGLFPNRQLWQPKKAYPWWDTNWDGKEPPEGTPREEVRRIREEGVTRHIILIRHGQYDETYKVCGC